MKLSVHSPVLLRLFSTLMTLGLVFSLFVVAPLELKNYKLDMKLASSSGYFDEYGYWATSSGTLFAYFTLPPMLGFASAIALRRHIKNLLLRTEPYFRKQIRRPLARWDGIGAKDFREDLHISLQFLPLFIATLAVYGVEDYVFPGSFTLSCTFLATCGFGGYGTWKRIFDSAMDPADSDSLVTRSAPDDNST